MNTFVFVSCNGSWHGEVDGIDYSTSIFGHVVHDTVDERE